MIDEITTAEYDSSSILSKSYDKQFFHLLLLNGWIFGSEAVCHGCLQMKCLCNIWASSTLDCMPEIQFESNTCHLEWAGQCFWDFCHGGHGVSNRRQSAIVNWVFAMTIFAWMKTAAWLDTYNVRHTVCWAHNQQQKPLLHLNTVWWLFYTTFMEKALWPSYITSHNGIMSEGSTLWLCREGHRVKYFQSSSQSTRIVMPPPSFLARGTWNLGQRVKPRELAFSVVSSLNQILVAFQRAFFSQKSAFRVMSIETMSKW